MCKCKNIEIGSYDRQTLMRNPFTTALVGIDTCLVQEIAELWYRGVFTVESCCGHNKRKGYIAVNEKDIVKMKELGYKEEGNGSQFFLPLNI